MRHRKSKFQLNRFTSWRKATLINLAKNLIIHQSIKTTKTKALAVRSLIEKLISLGKVNTLSAKRQAYEILGNHRLVSSLFNDVAPLFANRVGGYTRILDLDRRQGDNAELVILEFTEIKKKEKRKKVEREKEIKSELEKEPQVIEEKKPKIEAQVLEKPPIIKKPAKKFLRGLKSIFKKERDSL